VYPNQWPNFAQQTFATPMNMPGNVSLTFVSVHGRSMAIYTHTHALSHCRH
jgi:hypothetical protein